MNYNPKVILAGRKINDHMAVYASKEILKILSKKKIKQKSKILILGYTFKENCSDYRNTQIEKIKNLILKSYNNLDIFDPFIKNKIGKNFLTSFPKIKNYYDCIIIAVPHTFFVSKQKQIIKIANQNCLFFDLRSKMKKINNQWNL